MEKVFRSMGAPPVYNQNMMDKLAAEASLPPKPAVPDASFTQARTDAAGRLMPQVIAHRGDKANYPENTMLSFRNAVDVGAHALETDVHLTKDEVVVLSHDSSLSRCFGVDRKLLDCKWNDVKDLRSTRKPHEPIPRLIDLLEYLAQPELAHVWLLLDIKVDNNPHDIMRLMAKTVSQVKAPEKGRWENRIILGCWAANFMPYCRKYFPKFAITNIGISIGYSRQFLSIPNVSFNLIQGSLVAPAGRSFIREARRKTRPVYAWTVNAESMMDWCIRRGLDGVITDNPKKFLDYCDKFNQADPPARLTRKLIVEFIRLNIFAWLFGLLFRLRYGGFRQAKESML